MGRRLTPYKTHQNAGGGWLMMHSQLLVPPPRPMHTAQVTTLAGLHHRQRDVEMADFPAVDPPIHPPRCMGEFRGLSLCILHILRMLHLLHIFHSWLSVGPDQMMMTMHSMQGCSRPSLDAAHLASSLWLVAEAENPHVRAMSPCATAGPSGFADTVLHLLMNAANMEIRPRQCTIGCYGWVASQGSGRQLIPDFYRTLNLRRNRCMGILSGFRARQHLIR